MATRMGLEPTTSAVTGRRSNQLSYQAISSFRGRLSATDVIIADGAGVCQYLFSKKAETLCVVPLRTLRNEINPLRDL